MKYQEIVNVEKHFKSAFDITADAGDSWKTFVSNDKFEKNLLRIIESFTTSNLNNRKSIWIQGTYGTGKSHSLAVIKHILSDDYSNIEDYLIKISSSQLRNNISAFRADKKVFTVTLKGIYSISDVKELKYVIQREVAAALERYDISTKTDFETILGIIESGNFDPFFKKLISENKELHSYASDMNQLVKILKNNDTRVIRIISDALKEANLGTIHSDLQEWLKEVKHELSEKGIADYLLIMWDEFTSLLDIPARRSILNAIQDIAEMSTAETKNGETQGIYLLLVTHRKLEATETFKELKEDERNMARARFAELDYSMQPTTTYHILAGALERKKPELLENLKQERFLNVPSVQALVNRIVGIDTPNAAEIKKKIIDLYPFHPYTSYLATFVSRVVGESERSIFGFLNDEEFGFKKFIENNVDDTNFLTADYVWDFFFQTFDQSSAGSFDAITNKYKLVKERVGEQGGKYLVILKTILLLNILYRVTTTDGDTSESSLVNPSENNIIAAFSGVLDENEVKKILDYIDENQILHRNPDGIFEVTSSALPQTRLLEDKKKNYSNYEEASKIITPYTISCVSRLQELISNEMNRETDLKVMWGGIKELVLRNNLDGKFWAPHAINTVLFVFRGKTREMDEFLGRAEPSQEEVKRKLIDLSKEKDNENYVFIISNVEFGNKRFESFMDSVAQTNVARAMQLTDERRDGEAKCEKWAMQWRDEISNGTVDIIFRGDVLHTNFAKCSKELKSKYARVIFNKSFDGLLIPNTTWKKQISNKAVELVLYANSKTEFENTVQGTESGLKTLLQEENNVLFNEQLEIQSNDRRFAMVSLFENVKQVIDSNKDTAIIDLAYELRFLSKPPFGYYGNRVFMAALSFALRPYIDKLYLSGSGTKIDKTVMKELVLAIFNNWTTGKTSDKYVVRISTAEETGLTEKLCSIFGLDNCSGLISTKWAIRSKFQKENGSPLWALKYTDNVPDKLAQLIDKLFDFSKKTDDSIEQQYITELYNGVKTYSVDLKSIIAGTKNQECLDKFIIGELKKIDENVSEVKAVKDYLEKNMQGELVFWEEKEIGEKILRWKICKDRKPEELVPTDLPKESCDRETDGPTHNNQGQKETILKRLSECNSEELYSLISSLIEKYGGILNDIELFFKKRG